MKHKAVVLGVNYYIGLSVMRNLGKHKIPIVAVDYQKKGAYGFASKYCDERLIAPHYQKEAQAFCDFLVDYARKQTVKPVLYPCADPYVEFVDRYFDQLKEVYLFDQTQKGLFTQVMDKKELYQLAQKHQVLVPTSLDIHDPDLLTKAAQMGYPWVIKPADSPSFVRHFRVKMLFAENEEQLKKWLVAVSKTSFVCMVQQVIPGFDDHMVTYDAYCDQNSEVTHWVTCQKYRQYPINFGASVYTGQKYIPQLHQIGAPFFKAIGWKGFAEIEFKKHAHTGDFYLIEVNVRTTNFNEMLTRIGLNFPYITYQRCIGEPVEPMVIDYDTHKVFWYAYEDMLAIRQYLKTKQLTMKQICSSLRKSKVEAIFALDDIKPFFAFVGYLGSRAIKKISRRKS